MDNDQEGHRKGKQKGIDKNDWFGNLMVYWFHCFYDINF